MKIEWLIGAAFTAFALLGCQEAGTDTDESADDTEPAADAAAIDVGASEGGGGNPYYISYADAGYWLVVSAHVPAQSDGSCHVVGTSTVSLRLSSSNALYDANSDWAAMTFNGIDCEFVRAYVRPDGYGATHAILYRAGNMFPREFIWADTGTW